MRIKEITDRLSNDIFGILECEHCGATRKFTGYDDENYHKNVLPSFCCNKCGRNRLGERPNASKYRKKPVVIDAIQWTGNNETKVAEFTKNSNRYIEFEGDICRIQTLEGLMTASKGDYIIKGVKGEFYPCKPDIFEETYEDANTADKMQHVKKAIEILTLGRTFYDGYFDNIETLSRTDKALKELLIAVEDKL